MIDYVIFWFILIIDQIIFINTNINNKIKMSEEYISDYIQLKQFDLQMMVASATFWTSFYVIVNLIPLPFKSKHTNMPMKDELDVKNRIVSFFHGLGLLILGAYTFYF